MNDPSELERGWRPTRWFMSVALVLLIQLALVLWLSRSDSVPTGRQGDSPRLRLAPDPMAAATVPVPWADPALFASAHRAGFSGRAWSYPSPLLHPLYEWQESPRWLMVATARLGRGDLPPASESLMREFRSVALSPPSPARVPTAGFPLPSQSRMVLEEDALQRRLAAFPQLPTLTHSNVLRPSILEYAVHPLGTVFSVRLVESSGWDAADQQAFRIVKALRFQPQDPLPPFTVPPPDLRSGRVWIHWSIAQPADNPGPGS